MNKKNQNFSTLTALFLITALSGCDWCSCCMKDKKSAPTAQKIDESTATHPTVVPKHPAAHSVTPVHPTVPEHHPMPEHLAMHPITPEHHPMPEHSAVHPVVPVPTVPKR